MIQNSKQILPKVTFKQMPLELEAEMFFGFLDDDYWGIKITDKYPEFLKIKEIEYDEEKKLEIKKLILEIRSNLRVEIDAGLERAKINWQKIEKDYLEKLPEIIQTDWPEKEIIAYISINPVCPRFIDSWSFSVSFDSKNSNIILAHEISHFLFFKNVKEILPEINKENYESPHKEWLLSELVAVIISHDSRIYKILGIKDDFYPEHKILKVSGKPLTVEIEKLYNKFVIEGKDFSKFIIESLKIIGDLK